ncbi:hypothetical protein LAZ67_7002956 [Cordylochernes scorpioides]|uniref:Retrotransposon gag domain-containing protein n=1 Tax=Cordylochernes scorpioides TaxID=51811 RepID=A0ABY6KQH9_9ARAC|nr:hypothetical protein LAZ67_7002956 [Cordylochernes scorpioides]
MFNVPPWEISKVGYIVLVWTMDKHGFEDRVRVANVWREKKKRTVSLDADCSIDRITKTKDTKRRRPDSPDRSEKVQRWKSKPNSPTIRPIICPQQETTFEEEETSPPQETSADPLTQIADALSKLLVARSPREIDVSPYDGTFEAQSFFDNFDAQADRAELTYTDRLRKLPCYLQGLNTPSLQRQTTHNLCTKMWYPHPAQGPEPCSPSPSCKPRRLYKPREQLNVGLPCRLYCDASTQGIAGILKQNHKVPKKILYRVCAKFTHTQCRKERVCSFFPCGKPPFDQDCATNQSNQQNHPMFPPNHTIRHYFYLSGTALKWFENNEESIQTWEEFTSQLENGFGKNKISKLKADKKLKTRAQLKGESTEFYIQDVLHLCKEVDPQMSDEDKISHLMKGIAEEVYQALLPRNVQSTEQFITECRHVEALRHRRVTPTRYERLPNVSSLCDQDDGENLSSLIEKLSARSYSKNWTLLKRSLKSLPLRI